MSWVISGGELAIGVEQYQSRRGGSSSDVLFAKSVLNSNGVETAQFHSCDCLAFENCTKVTGNRALPFSFEETTGVVLIACDVDILFISVVRGDSIPNPKL